MYLFTTFITLLIFFPIDITAYGYTMITNLEKYFLLNISMLTILFCIYSIAVPFLNRKFGRKKIFQRILIEIIYVIILINLIVFFFQNVLMGYVNPIVFFTYTFKHNFLFISILEGIFYIFLFEVLFLFYQRLEETIEKERFKYIQLKNQLNPHFLFNSLNISISLIKKDQEKAVEYMKKLSLVYRYVLINTESNFVSLKEEIDFIKKYIDILQIRYDEGLNVTYTIEDKALNMQIVPLSLQLLVENAVKHNATYSDNPLNIHIYSEEKQIVVANNIIKKTTVIDSIGVGLKNLNQKYNILLSKDIQIINDSKNFIVRIPLK